MPVRYSISWKCKGLWPYTMALRVNYLLNVLLRKITSSLHDIYVDSSFFRKAQSEVILEFKGLQSFFFKVRDWYNSRFAIAKTYVCVWLLSYSSKTVLSSFRCCLKQPSPMQWTRTGWGYSVLCFLMILIIFSGLMNEMQSPWNQWFISLNYWGSNFYLISVKLVWNTARTHGDPTRYQVSTITLGCENSIFVWNVIDN